MPDLTFCIVIPFWLLELGKFIDDLGDGFLTSRARSNLSRGVRRGGISLFLVHFLREMGWELSAGFASSVPSGSHHHPLSPSRAKNTAVWEADSYPSPCFHVPSLNI